MRYDPEPQGAATVSQILGRWLQVSRAAQGRCVDWFVNGMPLDSTMAAEFVGMMPTAALEGLEFYRDDLTAPLEYQGKGSCLIKVAAVYSIIAIWCKRQEWPSPAIHSTAWSGAAAYGPGPRRYGALISTACRLGVE